MSCSCTSVANASTWLQAPWRQRLHHGSSYLCRISQASVSLHTLKCFQLQLKVKSTSLKFSTPLRSLSAPHRLKGLLSKLDCKSETAEPFLHCLAELASPGQQHWRQKNTTINTIKCAGWNLPLKQRKAFQWQSYFKILFLFLTYNYYYISWAEWIYTFFEI